MKTILLSFFVALILSQNSFAQNICEARFPAEVAQSGADLVASLKPKKIPYYMIQYGNKSIPVILANKETIERVKSLFETTIGFEVMSKAGWPNDHGSFRYGQFIIDAFLAGQRQVGEIHETGLSWKTSQDSAVFLDKIADIIGEAVVPVTNQEMRTIDIYERVRRAALYRVPFKMGDQGIYNKFDNVLSECGGYCFEFSHSTTVSGQKLALTQRLENLDPGSAVRNASAEAISKYITQAQTLLQKTNVYDAGAMSEKILFAEELKPLVSAILPKEWDVRKSQLFLAYLVSENAVSGMASLISSLQLQGNDPMSLSRSPRVQAIVVWDPKATEESFNNGTYQGRAQTFTIPSGVAP